MFPFSIEMLIAFDKWLGAVDILEQPDPLVELIKF